MFGLTRKKDNGRELMSPLGEFRREMDRLFESFFPESGGRLAPVGGWGRSLEEFSPRVNISDNDKEVAITAELPGVDEKDLEISVTRNSLTIRGEKKDEKEEKEGNYWRVERSYGAFERTLPLPTDVLTEKVEASFSKGVLKVVLPKTPEARTQTKHVKVRTE